MAFLLSLFPSLSNAVTLRTGEAAPTFVTQTHEGNSFDLQNRKGRWTVLYFYPKAETPGCTKQACAFRDSIKSIRDLDAEVYGVSTDDVPALKKFHENHKLNFELLSDAKGEIVKSYGTKMPLISVSKRYTFVLDPKLQIRYINTEVDPAKDPQVVSNKIKELKAQD